MDKILESFTKFFERKNISSESRCYSFDGSIRQNVSYGKVNATEEEIKEAKSVAADEFISQMPNSYETLIGENGVKLSGIKTKNINCKSFIKILNYFLVKLHLLDAGQKVVQNAILNLTKQRNLVIAIDYLHIKQTAYL